MKKWLRYWSVLPMTKAIEINIDTCSVEDVEWINNDMIDLYEFLEGVYNG